MNDSTENDDRNVERRGSQSPSVDLLQQSLDDVLVRRRRLSMDNCEHINKGFGGSKSSKSSKSISPHRRLPPRPAASKYRDYHSADDMSSEEDTTEPSSTDWMDSEEMTMSGNSLNHMERNERSSSRGRGLFRGLSRKPKPKEAEEDWGAVSDGFSRSFSTSSTSNNKINSNTNNTNNTNTNNTNNNNNIAADGSQSKRFLLQKVDSIRMARNNRKEAKRTALEDSLMQQLAKMQLVHEGEMEEFALKLRQREAAIETLEKALTIKTETVDSLRNEMDIVMQRLEDAEAKAKKQEKKLAKKQLKKGDLKLELTAGDLTAGDLTARARSSSPSAAAGEISSRRRLKEKKPSERNLQELMEVEKPRRADLSKTRKDMSVRSMGVVDTALRRPQSDHPRRRNSGGGGSDTSSLIRPTKSDHRRPSGVQGSGESDRSLDETRRRSSGNGTTATASDRHRRSSIEEKRQAQNSDSFEDLAGRPHRKSIEEKNQPRRRLSTDSGDSFSYRLCMDSLPPSRPRRNDDPGSRSRGAADNRNRAADSRGRAEQQRRDHDEQQRVFAPPRTSKGYSLDDKIDYDRARAERRGMRPNDCRTEATKGSRRSAAIGSRSCADPRRAHSDDGEPRSSSNVRPSMRTPSRGTMQRAESSPRFHPRPMIKP
jgi:hypothetical protein